MIGSAGKLPAVVMTTVALTAGAFAVGGNAQAANVKYKLGEVRVSYYTNGYGQSGWQKAWDLCNFKYPGRVRSVKEIDRGVRGDYERLNSIWACSGAQRP